MTDEKLLRAIEFLRDTMIAVATGGPRIDDVNVEFQRTHALVAAALVRRGLHNPIPYATLWDWYSRWRSGDLPTYQSRREHVSEIFSPMLTMIRTGRFEEFQPTGWARVDRTVGEIRDRLAGASREEQFQAVGLLCREALISTALAVYVPERHPTPDGVVASPTDAKRMLEAYAAVELAGSSYEETRRHARSSLDLAASLQHRRTASFRDAAICVEATTTVINIVAIVSGRRDPKR